MAQQGSRGVFQVGQLLIQGGVRVLTGAGAPTSGTGGVGYKAGPGSIYVRTSNGAVYVNTNTAASPTWGALGTVAALTDGNIFVGNGSNAATGVTPSGDLTMTNLGVFSIGADKVAATQLGVTAGTGTASKALVLSAAGKLTITATAPTTSSDAFTVQFTSGSATPGTCRALVGAATSFSSMTSGGLVGVRGVVTQAAAVSGASNYGVQGKYVTGSFSAAGTLAAVYAQFDMTGGTIGAGNIAVIQANVVGCASGTVALNGIYVENAGGGAINAYARLLGNATFVLDIESSFTNQSTSGTAGSTAAKGWLKCQITNGGGTVTRYIPLTDSVS